MHNKKLESMDKLFSLGEIYPSDFVKDMSHCPEKFELQLQYDSILDAVKLTEAAPLDLMYGKYWYRSGINSSMREELKDIVNSIKKVKKLKEGSVWLDIACNDGTLFDFLEDNVYKIGIDPADDSYKKESEKKADVIIQDFFSSKIYFEKVNKQTKADVVTSIAVFYDIEEPVSFINDVRKVLKDDGLWVLQLSYTPLMIKQLAFDNICHEHIFYYWLDNLKNLLESNGFKVMDCQLNETNGGSFRVFAIPQEALITSFATKPFRDVAEYRIEGIIRSESNLRMNSEETWKIFFNNVLELKSTIVSFVKDQVRDGKRIWCYGASTKGNTLLQFFGLDNSLIEGIAERSPYKYGLKTIGTLIPIYSEEEMRASNPDYLLILPWHFIDEFTEREKEYLLGGGKFIVPCPEFRIITSQDLK